ncbi:hypothetical protein D917_05247, partial [Trichinella nativa]
MFACSCTGNVNRQIFMLQSFFQFTFFHQNIRILLFVIVGMSRIFKISNQSFKVVLKMTHELILQYIKCKYIKISMGILLLESELKLPLTTAPCN